MIQVTTENGTVYLLDTDAQTWHKAHGTARSGQLRTESGTYFKLVEPRVGRPLEIYGPGLQFGTRLIYTSRIMQITDVTQEAI